MERALIDLIHKIVGAKRNYTFGDLYRVLDALVSLMSEGK